MTEQGESSNHVIKEKCPQPKAQCEFNHVGCLWEGLQQDMADHLEQQWRTHSTLLVQKHTTVMEEKWASKVAELSKRFTQELTDQRRQINLLQSKLNDHETKIAAIKKTTKTLTRELDELREEQDDVDFFDEDDEVCEMCGDHHGIEPDLNLLALGTLLNALPRDPTTVPPTSASSGACSSTPFQFHVDRFSFKKNQHQCHHSPAFYLRNYRMQITVFPYGRYGSKGSHVGVYAHILRGEYDNQLKWPFRGRLTVHLLSQKASYSNHVRHIVYDDSVSYKYSGRCLDGSPSLDYGIDQFLPFSSIQYYISNDTLTFELPHVEDC